MPGTVAVMDTEPDNIKAGEAGEETTSVTSENERTQVKHGKEDNTKEEHSKEESDKAENGNVDCGNGKKEKKKSSIIKKMKNVRNSIRRGSKELNGTEAGTAMQNADPESQARTSPTPNIGSSGMSPRSPLSPSSTSSPMNIDSLSQSHKHGRFRSLSDSTHTNIDTEETKRNFLRRSLRWSMRKDKDPKPDLHTLNESINEENVGQVQEGEAQQLSESYELPEIPANPLSVMQINTLIGNMELEDAHLNLLSLRLELQKELEEKGKEDTPVELVKKEKDLNLLYSALRDKMKVIVKDSSNQPSCTTEPLICVARIIQEEEKREGDPGSAGWNWRDTWKEAVQEGVQAKIKSVPLDSKEQNTSWLAVHLGLLSKTVMEDLENVQNHLKGSYPPSFNVLNTYVESYHERIAQHLKDIPQKDLEAKDCYALLNWIVNHYKSAEMMGSPTLQPDMSTDSISLPLEDGFLDRIKKTYCLLIKDDIKTILGNVIKLQSEDGWIPENEPELDEGFYHSEIHMDILTAVKPYCRNSRTIDEDLEARAVCICLEQLQGFFQQFEAEFCQWCETQNDTSPGDKYRIAYINSFMALKAHLEEYRESSPQQVEQLGEKIDGVVHSLSQTMIARFQGEVKPFLRRMMTKKWLSSDEDFRHIVRRMEDLSQLSRRMKPPYVQTFGSKVHYLVVKEYVSQLMKNNYCCKNRKNERAAEKMGREWTELMDVFAELNSDATWLHPLGEHLCKIIGQKNKREIKNGLQPFVNDYPDISQKHLSAVLYFRGMVRGRERQLILRRLGELKRTAGHTGSRGQMLFSDIQVATNTDCLANMPLLCLGQLQPDS